MTTAKQRQRGLPDEDGADRAVADAAAKVASMADILARAATIAASRLSELERAAALVELADVKARLGALFDRMRRRRRKHRPGGL
jgi:hypothetical protein